MAVFIVSDSSDHQCMLEQIVCRSGMRAVVQNSGEEALAVLRQSDTEPSLLLLDFGSHSTGLIPLVQHLRSSDKHRYVQIIALTDSNNNVPECASELDAVVNSPIDETELALYITSHKRNRALYRYLSTECDQLRRARLDLDAEHQMAQQLIAVHNQQSTGGDRIHAFTASRSAVHGDYHTSVIGPTGSTYVVVGDVSGTGLPAAIGSLPLISAFRDMAEKGMTVGSIAAEMNRVALATLPEHMLAPTTVIEVSNTGNQLSLWSGGMPPIVLVDAEGRMKEIINSDHQPLGKIADLEFIQDVQVKDVAIGDKVVICTDGVLNATDFDNTAFGEGRYLSIFDGSASDTFNAVQTAIQDFTEGAHLTDDFSLVEVRCQPADGSDIQAQAERKQGGIPWVMSIPLEAEDLKNSNPVPQIVKILSKATSFDVHQDYVSTILSELFSNALEHGVLGLDSKLKESDDGFMEYYTQREERLANLKDGWVNIEIRYRDGLITLTLHDSGEGFDYGKIDSLEDNSFGRGTKIIESLCERIEYSHGGACVSVDYRLT